MVDVELHSVLAPPSAPNVPEAASVQHVTARHAHYLAGLFSVHTAILVLLAALLPIIHLGPAILIQKHRQDFLHGPQRGNDHRHMH